MAEALVKTSIKKAMDYLFSFQFDDLKTTENYIELTNLCINLEGISVKQWLILKVLEIIFIDDNKFKVTLESEETLKYFDYLIEPKVYANNEKFRNDFLAFIKDKEYSKIFQNLKIKQKDKEVLEFICVVKKDNKILFDCLDAIFRIKLPNYVSTKCLSSFKEEFEVFLMQLKSFLEYHDFENEKEYISLIYDDIDDFDFKTYSYEEAEALNKKNNTNPVTYKMIKKYISKNSIKVDKDESTIKEKSNIDIKETESIKEDIKLDSKEEKLIEYIRREIKKEYDDKINLLQKENNEIKSKYNEIQSKYNEIQSKYNEIQNKYTQIQKENIDIKNENENIQVRCDEIEEKYNEFQKSHERKIRSMKKYHENDINRINNQILLQKKYTESLINKEKEKYSNLNEKYENEIIISNNLKEENKNQGQEIINLNQEKGQLNNKLDKISCRGISKSLIDFFYFVYTEKFKGSNYSEEKDSIITKLRERDETQLNEVQKKILTQLIEYLDKIYNYKLEGDDYAHPFADLGHLIKLIGIGYENLNNLLMKLDLSVLFNRYNEYYKLKSRDEDVGGVVKEIQVLLIEKRDNYYQLFRDLK